MDPDRLIGDLPDADGAAAAGVACRAARILRPSGAFAPLDEVAAWLAGWQRTDAPAVSHPAAVVFVADHGVAAAEVVSAYPPSVTAEMLRALETGAATAAVLARAVGASLTVVDVGVGRPTGDIRVEPALDDGRFGAAWQEGEAAIGALPARTDLLVLGEMGIGNTTAAAAVAAALAGGAVQHWVGRGTGVDDDGLARKRDAVERAVRRVPAGASPLEVLRHVGGAELVALAAAIVAARRRSLPVLLDGFVVTAAAAAVERQRPGALDHCWPAHRSAEHGHAALVAQLGRPPLLDLGLRLGEGSGALLAVPLVAMAAAAVTEVATFEEWGLGRP